MTLAKGDHLVIKRHGIILRADHGEMPFEFEVEEISETEDGYHVRLKPIMEAKE